MRYLLLFLFIPLLSKAQGIPFQKAASTYYQQNRLNYLQVGSDSTIVHKSGIIAITPANITIDGVSYTITQTDPEVTDSNCEWWETLQCGNTPVAIHRFSNYELEFVQFGGNTYYFR